jgi:peroxiredoxin
MKKIILAALCLFFTGNLIAQNNNGDSIFRLKGEITAVRPGQKVYLIYQTEGRNFMDSAQIVNQQFHLQGKAAEPLFATLVLDHEGAGLKSLMKKPVDEIDLLKLYLHNGEIQLSIKDSIGTAVFTRSDINKEYAKLKEMQNIADENKLYKLSARMQKLRTPESEKQYVSFYDSLKSARQPVLKRFIQENQASYIALVALKEYAGAFPDTQEIKPLFNALSRQIKNSNAGMTFNTLLNGNVAVGTIAPDFMQNDPAGNPVKLSSLRGKFVLIDFWASWCPSCREDNPKLVKAYHELKDKNFTILGVSLDAQDTRAAWVKAIKDDGLDWLQVSDLKHWDNAVIKQYGIGAIPQNVLIDPDGRVIAKNIEPGQLRQLLETAKNK